MRLTERISVERWQPDDKQAEAACYSVMVAAHLVDERDEPPMSAGVFGLAMNGWGHRPGEVWYVPADTVAGGEVAAGQVAALYRLDLPDLENLDRAELWLRVHPELRRRGIGGALLRHAAQRAAANGRTILEAAVPEGTAGDAFAQTCGATLQIEEVRRFQQLRTIQPGRIAELRTAAAEKAAGYTLVRWTGPVPDEYAAQVAGVLNAFNDAPKGENVEDSHWDADRVRQRTGSSLRAGLMRGYTVTAVHDASGEMAAFTEIVVDPTTPDWGWQQVTAVTRTHRGHRLGLLVKTAMLEWLAEAEPQLEHIETGNAATNKYMIAVNETLGYVVAPPGWRFYELPVATLFAAQS